MPLDAIPHEKQSPHQAILDELVTLGTDLARRIHAAAAAGELSLEHAATAFDHVSRSVRRTILLSRRLDEPASAQLGSAQPQQHRAAARKRLIRDVEDTIARTTRGPESEQLQAEFQDRLDSPDLEDEIGTRPVAEIIADICRDLGIATPPGMPRVWKRRTPNDLANLVARAAHPTPKIGPPSPALVATESG